VFDGRGKSSKLVCRWPVSGPFEQKQAFYQQSRNENSVSYAYALLLIENERKMHA
jgi:hypothetical protein